MAPLNIRIGPVSDFLVPGYSACKKCRTNWAFVQSHGTMITECGGMLPLCEKCWSGLSPERRLPFYKKLYLEWASDESGSPFTWDQIERAVLAEGKSDGK